MTREDLRGIVEGITDEQLKRILDINTSDIGKAKGEVENLQKELKTANDKVAEYEGEISTLKESLGDTEKMQKKIDDLQKNIDDRKAEDEAAAAEKAVKGRFDAVCSEANFLNDFTRAGVFNEFKAALSDEANASKSDAEIYKAITEGKDNLFMLKGGFPEVVSSTTGSGSTATDADVREIMGLPPIETK